MAVSVTAEYLRLAEEVAALPESIWLAVDLTHLSLDIDPRQCAEHLAETAAALPADRGRVLTRPVLSQESRVG